MSKSLSLKSPVRLFSHRFIILMLVACVSGLMFNGSRPLWDTSETRYAETSRAMAWSGDYLVPRLDGAVHLTKPPLTYWAIASSFRVFGKNEWAARLPSALAYIAGVALVTLLALEMTGSVAVGITAGWLQLSAPLAMAGAHVVTTDGILAALELAYVLAFWKVRNAGNLRQARLWSLGMWGLAGLAFLTKGPPALLLGLVCIAFTIMQKKEIRWRRYLYPEGLIVFVLVAGSWFALVLLRLPDALTVWKAEALHKVVVESTRDMPWWLYVPILLGGCLPASLIVALGWGGQRNLPRSMMLFCQAWVVIPLVIFMLAKTRLPLYVIPLVPAFSIGAAALYHAGRLRGINSRFARAAPTIMALVFLGMKFSTPWWDDESKDLKPVAMSIARDAQASGTRPELVLTMPVMGHGLSFYLDGPPLIRTSNSADTPGAIMGSSLDKLIRDCAQTTSSRSARLACALGVPPEAGFSRYVVAQADKAPRFQEHFRGYLTTVTLTSKWVAWKQTDLLPPDYVMPRKKTKSL